MLFTEWFGLKVPKEELTFVDISLDNDTLLFIDPAKIRLSEDDWCREVTLEVQEYFGALLNAVQVGDLSLGMKLLGGLSEPTETRLGYASGMHGHGVGPTLAVDIWQALTQSAAAKSGLLSDLEEAALLIDNIDRDRISDIVTNVIRSQLTRFTQDICVKYGVPTQQVRLRVWDVASRKWKLETVSLPMFEGKPLLLVPMKIVSNRMYYEVKDYVVQAVVPFLQDLELNSPGQDLVRLLKNKKRRVYKKDVVKKYGSSKAAAIRLTQQYPAMLENYRQKKDDNFKW